MEKTQNKYKIISNEKLCPRFYRLCCDAKPILKKVQPGQFIHVKITEGLKPFLRRPFTVYRAQKYVEILYEVVGTGTQILALKKKGDCLDVLGPLGNSLSIPPKGARQVVMIAGGVGIAPFLFFSDTLVKKGYEMILLYGGRTKSHVYQMEEFKQNGCKVYVATDDGSVGIKGRVTKLFSKINIDPQTTMLYVCGPRPMMASAQGFARRYNLNGQAICEEILACGLGTCLGCSTQTVSGYKTVCFDGPVFDLQEIVF